MPTDNIIIHKVLSLPPTLDRNALYFIKENDTQLSVHMSTNDGTSKATINANHSHIQYVSKTENNTFSKAQRGQFVELTSSNNVIAIDLNTSNNFFHETTENTTLATPINIVPGQSGIIEFKQGSTLSELSFSSFYKFPGGGVPTLTQIEGHVDLMSYMISFTGTMAYCVMMNDMTNNA